MSRSEDIDNGYWDEVFGLPKDAKLLYVWSWTNTRCHFSGIYQVALPVLCLELDLTQEEARAAFAALEADEKVFYDGAWLWNKARVKRLKTRTVQMCKAVAKDLARVPPEHPYRVRLLELQGAAVWQSGDTRTTITETLGYLTGGSPVTPGPHAVSPGSSRNSGSPAGATPVAPMTGTVTGTRPGPSKRRTGGRARMPIPTTTPYTEDPAMRAFRDEHFPTLDVALVQSAAAQMRMRRQDPTVDALREWFGDLLDPTGRDAA